MWRIHFLVSFFTVFFSNRINIFVLTFNFVWENRHSIFELLYISCLVFREIHINKASHSMSVSCQSNISIFIMISIYRLLIQFRFILLRTQVRTSIIQCLQCWKIFGYFLLFFGIILIDVIQILKMFLLFIIKFSTMNLLSICFLELMILF